MSTILAANNGGRDIKSLLENLGSTYKTNLESGDLFEDNQKEKDLLIKCLQAELIGWRLDRLSEYHIRITIQQSMFQVRRGLEVFFGLIWRKINGSPGTRTQNYSVKSRVLYHWVSDPSKKLEALRLYQITLKNVYIYLQDLFFLYKAF